MSIPGDVKIPKCSGGKCVICHGLQKKLWWIVGVRKPGAKTINVFQAGLGAQLTICAQKWRNFVLFSTVSLRFVLSQVCVFFIVLAPGAKTKNGILPESIRKRRQGWVNEIGQVSNQQYIHRLQLTWEPGYFDCDSDILSRPTGYNHRHICCECLEELLLLRSATYETVNGKRPGRVDRSMIIGLVWVDWEAPTYCQNGSVNL